MFYLMCKLQSFSVYLRGKGVLHKPIDYVVQRLPFQKYLA